jgi:hypothetical protein
VLRSTDLSARSDRWREFWVSWGRRQAFEFCVQPKKGYSKNKIYAKVAFTKNYA